MDTLPSDPEQARLLVVVALLAAFQGSCCLFVLEHASCRYSCMMQEQNTDLYDPKKDDLVPPSSQANDPIVSFFYQPKYEKLGSRGQAAPIHVAVLEMNCL